jgi:Sugar phosphate isomerases/epimerases
MKKHSEQKHLESFGVITGNTGGKWLKDNPKEGLKLIAELGYKELEFGGDFGLGFDFAKKHIADLGLLPLCHGASMHGIAIDKEAFKRAIEEAQKWEKKYFVCYYPFPDGVPATTLDQWKQIAGWCNEAGRACKEAGLEFLYHNHDFEFHPVEAATPFDFILQNTDPDIVNMEMDVYWTSKGGASPIFYMENYPGRFPALHVKDMDATPKKGFADAGSGIINFPEIFSRGKIAGTKHFIVEHDNPANGKASLAASANYLRALKYKEL